MKRMVCSLIFFLMTACSLPQKEPVEPRAVLTPPCTNKFLEGLLFDGSSIDVTDTIIRTNEIKP